MSKARVARILAALQYCIDETGHVDHIAVIRSSGLPGYDAKLVKAVGNWTHKPYLDEGKPVAVCSSVHFIYSQKAGSRLPGMMR